jgi:hypothetical protein
MSLAETQQIMQVLQEIMQLLNGVTIKTEQIKRDIPQTREALATFRQLERIALRFLVLAKRMGLPEDIDRGISKVMELIVAIRMLQMSMNMMMASNPYTMIIGMAGFAGSIMTFGSMLEGY